MADRDGWLRPEARLRIGSPRPARSRLEGSVEVECQAANDGKPQPGTAGLSGVEIIEGAVQLERGSSRVRCPRRLFAPALNYPHRATVPC